MNNAHSQDKSLGVNSIASTSYLPLILIFILALFLYLYRLEFRGLWIDEFISLKDAEKLEFNRGRILYYYLLHFWMKISTNDSFLRGLSIVFSLGSILFLYQLAKELFNDKIAILSGLFLTLSPLFINHAQEVRYYGLSNCLGIAGTWVLLLAMKQPNNHLLILAWSGLRFLAVITTPLNASLFIPDGLIIFKQFDTEKQQKYLFNFISGFLFSVFLCLGSALSVVNSSGEHRLIVPIPDFSDVIRELRMFTVYIYPPSQTILKYSLQLFSLGILGLIVTTFVVKRKDKNVMKIALWGFIPLGMIFLFSHIFFSIWITRYLMFATSYIFIYLAVGGIYIWKKWKVVGFMLLGSYIMLVSIGLKDYYDSSSRYMGADDTYRSIARVINQQQQKGDIIIWSNIHGMTLLLDHYYQGTAPIYNISNLFEDQNNPQRLEQWFQELPSTSHRIWLIYSFGKKQFCQKVKEHYRIVQSYPYWGGCSMFLVKPYLSPLLQ